MARVESGIKLFSTAKQIFSRIQEKGDFHMVFSSFMDWINLICELSFSPQVWTQDFLFSVGCISKENVMPVD